MHTGCMFDGADETSDALKCMRAAFCSSKPPTAVIPRHASEPQAQNQSGDV